MIEIDYNLLVNSLITIAVVIISLTVHEVSHGFVSHLLGDDTAKNMGRLTLNPLKHLDPVGAICMFFFRFGWAKAVPINPNYYKNYRLGTVIVSLAGPLSNLVMAFVTTLIYVFLMLRTDFYNEIVDAFLVTFIIHNISLAIFNLIPVSPLDGSKIALAFLPEKAYRFVLKYERFGFVILIALTSLGSFSGLLEKGLFGILSRFLDAAQMIIGF